MKKIFILFVFFALYDTVIHGQVIEPDFDGPSKSQQVQPMFPGCEDVEDRRERQKCADETMMRFVYGNIKYPAEAKKEGIEGMVVIKFYVEEDGSIQDAIIVRDIGGGCGEEALRVVGSMPDWHPSHIDGDPVRVQFNLPVKFKLGKGKKNK
ncbi:MAG: energy transducer TonB [Bacteroidota bacterium]